MHARFLIQVNTFHFGEAASSPGVHVSCQSAMQPSITLSIMRSFNSRANCWKVIGANERSVVFGTIFATASRWRLRGSRCNVLQNLFEISC